MSLRYVQLKDLTTFSPTSTTTTLAAGIQNEDVSAAVIACAAAAFCVGQLPQPCLSLAIP